MNVLVWCSWVARPVGGMEITALELAIELQRRGHQVVLAGAYDNAPELRARIPAGMPYYAFDVHRRRVKPHLKAARLLWRAMGEHRTEVVSAHGSVIAVHEVCRIRNVPLVWTLHGAGPSPKDPVGRLKTMAIRRILMSPNTHIIGVSRATTEIVRQEFPRLDEARLHVIGVGRRDENALTALVLPKAAPPWHLGFVGRLAERKRPLDLVAVANGLNNTLDYKFEVFGDGPLLEALRTAISAARLEHRFTLHGYWDRGSPSMVEQFQIMVHTDCVEPFGAALLEAQLGGRPVVAYRVGGNPDIIEHGTTGWLVPLGDVKGLAEGVRRITEKGFTEFAAASRQRATKLFPMARMVSEYETLFEQLCASH